MTLIMWTPWSIQTSDRITMLVYPSDHSTMLVYPSDRSKADPSESEVKPRMWQALFKSGLVLHVAIQHRGSIRSTATRTLSMIL